MVFFLRAAAFTKDQGVKKPNEFHREGDLFLWQWFGYCDDVQEKRKILSAINKLD
jgi:hypothetical protein